MAVVSPLPLTTAMAKDRPDLKAYVGQELTVIAWLWARTVESSNPAYRGCHVPLASSFWLSTKAGKEAYVEPVVEGKTYRFEVRVGKPGDKAVVDAGTKLGRGANFQCLLSQSPLSDGRVRVIRGGSARRPKACTFAGTGYTTGRRM
jgi:putative DNA methylase